MSSNGRGAAGWSARTTLIWTFRHTRIMPGLILASLLSALVCYLVAKSRSADRRFWLLMGLILGPLAIPFVFFVRPKSLHPGPSPDN